MQPEKITSFPRFYEQYLREHQHPVSRLLHYIGSWIVLIVIAATIFSVSLSLLWSLPVIGYGFAWIGHFVFERNKPATFRQPFFSLASDWVMWWQITSGRLHITRMGQVKKYDIEV